MARPETEAYSHLLNAEGDLMAALDRLKRTPALPQKAHARQLARAAEKTHSALESARGALAATAELRALAAESQEGPS